MWHQAKLQQAAHDVRAAAIKELHLAMETARCVAMPGLIMMATAAATTTTTTRALVVAAAFEGAARSIAQGQVERFEADVRFIRQQRQEDVAVALDVLATKTAAATAMVALTRMGHTRALLRAVQEGQLQGWEEAEAKEGAERRLTAQLVEARTRLRAAMRMAMRMPTPQRARLLRLRRLARRACVVKK
jgi:hypothetical protein